MATRDFPSSSSSSSAASSKTEPSSNYDYDVFISFRGEDTRKNFSGFLYRTLKNKGINAFFDSENLWTGEAIAPALLKAIEGSNISIPVISQGYVDSKWCLRELAQIVQCHRSNNQIILPIFFHVHPSDVRKQTGSFENAFLKYQEEIFEPKEVESWREALEVVGNLKGEVLDDTKDQAELIERVAKRVLSESVSSARLAECEYRIDMDSRVNDLLSLLDVGSNDVQFVGICGSGGLGKTTLAKAVYNGILSTFDKHCFLSEVRERATQFNGLVCLQKQLLKDIFKADFHIEDSHKGKRLIKERVSKEKVFLVLDDVDGKQQIDALAGKHNWFGQGSRVIITTRDEQILNSTKVNRDKIYKPQLLDHACSLQLFSWHAFQNSQPPEDYMQLSHDVVRHSEGLPLILEVFGSYLSDVGDKDEWESTLKMLKEIPPKEVQRKLRISYDNLENDYQRDIFLDAACFFTGWEKEIIISIWEACGYHPKSTVSRLIKRSLLKFDDECLVMHDHIRDMGREIVLEESRIDPSKRSRLWSYSDIVEVLEGHKGTQTIKGMSLSYASRPPIILPMESLEMMPNLRFLNVMNFKILCPNLYHRRLVALTLSDEDCNQLWNVRPPDEYKRFQNLKILKLSVCYSLSKSPEFSWFPSLEQLEFIWCSSLDELDNSIGQLSQLKRLIVRWCSSLKKLPDSIGDLSSLIKLVLLGTSIEELPDSISRMSSLEELILDSCASLKKLPKSMGDLKSLVKLDLSSTNIEALPDNISRLGSLKELLLMYCKSLMKLPESIGDLKSLVMLDLSYSGIEELPDNIFKMGLKEFNFKGCPSLKKLPESIDNILKYQLKLDLSGTSMEEVPISIYKISSLKEIIFSQCYLLKKLPDAIGDLRSLIKLDLSETSIEELPDSISRMSSLKELILVRCKSLKKLPQSIGDLKSLVKLDLSYSGIEELPDQISKTSPLKELILKGCKSLKKLPESIDSILKCQLYIDLSETGIEEVPNSICRISSLKEISFSHCNSLKRLPESIGDLKSLVKLDLSNSGIEELPDSISGMSSLKMLILRECWSLMKFPNVIGRLHELEALDFGGCTNLVKLPRPKGGTRCLDSIGLNLTNITKFPDNFSMPQNLVKLKVKHLGIQSFPLDIAPLKSLKQLKICGCGKVEYLPELPSNLVELCCEDCDSLGRLPDLSKLKSLTTLKLRYCRKLEEIPGLEGTESLEELNVEGCFNLRHAPRKTQATLSPNNRALALGSAHALTANDGIWNNGFILSFGLEFFFDDVKLRDGHPLAIDVLFSAIVHQKEKRIRCLHTVRIEDVKEPYDQETICSYHFKGFNWFGIPLQGEDCIQILDVKIHSFKWSYVDEVGGVVMLNYAPNQHQSIIFLNCIRLDPFSEALGQEEDSLNLTCWPRAEVEGLSTVPDKRKAEEEEEEDGNDVPTVDFLSRLGLNSVSDAMEEEEENNVPTVDFLSRLGLDSVSDVMAEEEDKLRHSYRVSLRGDNDDDDEAPNAGSCFCCQPFLFLRSLLFRS